MKPYSTQTRIHILQALLNFPTCAPFLPLHMASNEENSSASPELSEQVKESMDEENAGNLATHVVHKNDTILTDINSVRY